MTDNTLTVSDAEIRRYRGMAARARTEVATFWRRAGIVPGDVGCRRRPTAPRSSARASPDGVQWRQMNTGLRAQLSRAL
jgi:hypothetical protein